MNETKVFMGIASLCSLITILSVLFTIPQLFSTINSINARIQDGVQAFRVDTDSAWSDLMEVQMSVTPPAKPRENPFNSMFQQRQKRQGGLPSQCVCQLTPVTCPPGTPGPPGPAG